MAKSDNTSRDGFNLMRRLKDAGVPWPDLVSAYLLDIKEDVTRRAYRHHLVEWLPKVQTHDLRSIEREELVRIREAILNDSRSDESHRQAFAALQGCFQFFRDQYRFLNLQDDAIERIFGSERSYQRRVRDRFFKLSYQEAEEQGLL